MTGSTTTTTTTTTSTTTCDWWATVRWPCVEPGRSRVSSRTAPPLRSRPPGRPPSASATSAPTRNRSTEAADVTEETFCCDCLWRDRCAGWWGGRRFWPAIPCRSAAILCCSPSPLRRRPTLYNWTSCRRSSSKTPAPSPYPVDSAAPPTSVVLKTANFYWWFDCSKYRVAPAE